MSDPDQLTIGEVINLLRDEFPDISVSKVRFLESRGLLTPGRSDGGYRLFDPHDLARLRFILQQQRDHFLPLKVIKSKLTMWERGEEVDLAEDLGDSEPVQSVEPVSRAELLRRSGLTESQLHELEAHGVVEPEPPGSDTWAPEVAAVASDLRRLLALGLEARHLRVLRHAAQREADLLRALAVPLSRRDGAASGTAPDGLAACADSLQAVHKALLAVESRRVLGP